MLQGQSADYLVSALKAYAEGKRRSGIMQPLAADLRAEDTQNLADYYAGLTPPREEPRQQDAALIETGRKLATEGLPEAGNPPCTSCHGTPGTRYPRLAGQHAAYLAGQLRLWKAGHMPQTDIAALMASVGQRLNEQQINAVSAYFASTQPQVHEAQLP